MQIYKLLESKQTKIVIDLILAVVELLGRDINRLVVEAREVLELVELQDKGQPSYIILRDQFKTWECKNIGTWDILMH